ncbi:energy transducer TonB [Lysobacter enzymogenes]|uniref:energy transducer TonB n=1 Tax=Lysobacter enzymogenes TaxID=69 RepID=UPI00089737B6|nr:energy transducer TonB [Lysobacter enzymogenes]SDW93294.1 protein TonB [Lysobacter enzymogenes]
MSTPSPAPRRSFDLAAWVPSGKAWLWVVGAFAIGLALFAWVWQSNRNRSDGFYRADGTPPTSEQPFYAPLPAPAPADGSVGPAPAPQQVPESAPAAQDERPQLVENPNPPAPPQSLPSAPTAAAPAAPTGAHVGAAPLASNRAPQYPAASLRRGEGGTVRLQVQITEQGDVAEAEVVQGSGSRALDRAALSAVRGWRFQPATRSGRPVADTVLVPITFNPNQ